MVEGGGGGGDVLGRSVAGGAAVEAWVVDGPVVGGGAVERLVVVNGGRELV